MMINNHLKKILFKLPQICTRTVPRITCAHKISLFSSEINGNSNAWNKAISEAEKIVGFPTSFLSLRSLLSDEFGGLAIHLQKLVSTKHPLLNTAREILLDSKNYLQTRGLIVLLISRAVKSIQGDEILCSSLTPTEIYEKQRNVAEITELIHIAFLIHRGLIDVASVSSKLGVLKSDLEFGNRMAVLGGDFLLANACTCLAHLHNTYVVDLMSSAIEDMSTALVLLPEIGTSCNVEAVNHIPVTSTQWMDVIKLAHGSLLSRACHAAISLCGGGPEVTDAAERMASHLVLAQQAHHDILRVDSVYPFEQKPSFALLCSLPVVLLAEQNGGRAWVQNNMLKTKNDGQEFYIDYDSIKKLIRNDKYIMKRSTEICSLHVKSAIDALGIFPDSEAKKVLNNILLSVQQ